MQVRYLGQEDPLEGGIATHFTILAWTIAWEEHNSGYVYGGTSLMDP